MKTLTLDRLKKSASEFAYEFSKENIYDLFGVTDGKAVGTYVEHASHDYLRRQFTYLAGSSASGIDFPSLKVDIKVTSIKQPQSSCPFKAASQKIYGLGYNLIVFVYDKIDDSSTKAAIFNFLHCIFIPSIYTGDYQTTRGLLEILKRDANKDDIIAFLEERNLPLEEIGMERLAQRILKRKPKQGLLTVSNALQWRLQFRRIVSLIEKGEKGVFENLLNLKKVSK